MKTKFHEKTVSHNVCFFFLYLNVIKRTISVLVFFYIFRTVSYHYEERRAATGWCGGGERSPPRYPPMTLIGTTNVCKSISTRTEQNMQIDTCISLYT